MKEKQIDEVKEQLKKHGYVTRNWALRKYISRLGAIIGKLKKQGWDFEDGFFEKTETQWGDGEDYVYKLKAQNVA